jgi:hypothetical protein
MRSPSFDKVEPISSVIGAENHWQYVEKQTKWGQYKREFERDECCKMANKKIYYSKDFDYGIVYR